MVHIPYSPSAFFRQTRRRSMVSRPSRCMAESVLDSVRKQADTAMYEQKKLHKRLRSE